MNIPPYPCSSARRPADPVARGIRGLRPARAVALVVVTASLLLSQSDLHAKGGNPWPQRFGPSSGQALQISQAKGRLSADDAAAIVRRSGARVLDVRKSTGAYQVKLLTPEGRVRTVRVDAQTGRVSR